MRRPLDVFFVDSADPRIPGGLGLFGCIGDDLSLWRHHLACRPGLWRISVRISWAASQLLGEPMLDRDAVVDDFGTLQVVAP